MKVTSNILLPLIVGFLLVGCGSSEPSSDEVVTEVPTPTEPTEPEPTDPEQTKYHESGLYVQPIDNISADFIKGADISTLIEVEEQGGKFYDENGDEIDAIQALADHGVNWIRLRLWNNPYDVSWVSDVSGYEVAGAVGGGTNDLVKTLALAKRAKALDLKVLLDFHYSDFWTHPGQQYMPDAWLDLSAEQVEQALYDFTYDTLIAMNDEGVFPEMVQIGNEINSGLVAPQGNNLTSAGAIGLLKQGTSAVRAASEVANTQSKIMIHLAGGGDASLFNWAFDAFTEAALDYDIIGASYYPYWHGGLTELQSNLDALSEKYNKEVIVVETAYGYTLEDGPDGGGNIFSAESATTSGFAGTVQGQATAMREVMNVVANVPNDKGTGIFYWEPTWLAVGNTGWVSGKDNAWENQAMFDFSGNALDSLDVFWKVSETNQVQEPTVISATEVVLEFEQGADLSLPSQVKMRFSDDSFREVDIDWNDVNFSTDELGVYSLTGKADELDVSAQITVIDAVAFANDSAMKNYSFETGDLSQWEFSEDNTIVTLTDKTDEVHNGKYGLHFFGAEDFQQTISQTQTVANGTYRVTAWFMGGEETKNASMLIASSGGVTLTDAVEITGWGNWNQSSLLIDVTDGSLTVSVSLDEGAGAWGNIDEIKAELVLESTMINDSFEDGAVTPWQITTGNAGLALTSSTEETHSGDYGLHFWSEDDMLQTVTQTQQVANGTYKISAWFMGDSLGESFSELTASSGEVEVTEVAEFSGWANWNQSSLTIDVTDGSLTVAVVLDELAGSWGNIDDIKAELLQ